jgi:hypothetical protein
MNRKTKNHNHNHYATPIELGTWYRTACSGPGPSDRMSYVLQYIFSLFFVDRDVGPAGAHFFSPDRSGDYAANLLLSKYLTMVSRVDHDLTVVG